MDKIEIEITKTDNGYLVQSGQYGFRDVAEVALTDDELKNSCVSVYEKVLALVESDRVKKAMKGGTKE